MDDVQVLVFLKGSPPAACCSWGLCRLPVGCRGSISLCVTLGSRRALTDFGVNNVGHLLRDPPPQTELGLAPLMEEQGGRSKQ
ncbi:unnamed protein product [Boreogadus saida]